VNWIEILSVRSVKEDRTVLCDEIMKTLPRTEQPMGLVEIRAYRHGAVDTDFSIHLCWNSQSAERQGSRLAQSLLGALSDLGMANHSVWLEQDTSP
jgi:hypothetical protein